MTKTVTQIGLGILLFMGSAAGAQTNGGTAPHLTLRNGDPSTFEVRPTPTTKTQTETTGAPIILTIRNNAEGFRLNAVNPLPSSWVGPYKLHVESATGDGQRITRDVSIIYQPRVVAVTTAPSGEIRIPAARFSFRNGSRQLPILTENWTQTDGQALSGSRELRVSSHPDSTASVVIAGVQVNPGDVGVVLGQYDFTAALGKLTLPLMAAEDGKEGQARLWLTTDAPDSQAFDLTVHLWAPHVALAADRWNVRQAFDVAGVNVTPQSGNRCDLTTNKTFAQSADIFKAPRCFVEWTGLPEGMAAVSDVTPRAQGRLWQTGAFPVAYRVSLIDPGGTQVTLGGGTGMINVDSAEGLISFAPALSSLDFYRLVEPVSAFMMQNGGPACDTIVDAPGVVYRSTDAVVRCLFKWDATPDGAAQSPYINRPYLTGYLSTGGSQAAAWSVAAISPTGVRVSVGSGSFSFQVAEPPAPAITQALNDQVRDGVYAAPLTGGYAGDVVIEGPNAAYHVTVKEGERRVDDSDYEAWLAADNRRIVRRINASPAPLWSLTPWSIDTRYVNLPAVGAVDDFRIFAVPGDNIKPVLSVDQASALDTENVTVTVAIRDIYNQAAGYDAATMGQWRVRLGRYLNYNTIDPITDFIEAPNGEATFTLPPGALAAGTLRLTAEAAVISPDPDYTKSVYAVRPVSLTILRGGAIAANAKGRRLAGPAPLSTLLWAELDDRSFLSALGDVVWQISDDEGATWTDWPGAKVNKLRLIHTFQRGKYKVRATLKNRHSSAAFTTEEVEVVAFNVPAVKLSGPENIFVGRAGDYHLALSGKERGAGAGEINFADTEIQWSTDGGATFETGNQDISVSRATESRLELIGRARLLEAPADEPTAWAVARRRANFVAVKPVRVGIVGPSKVEYPMSGTFRGVASPPYQNMDVRISSAWTLPDGQTWGAAVLNWSPSATDREAGRATLRFGGEIEGVDGTAAETGKTVSVWQYVWPGFQIAPSKDSQYAPATVTARAKPIGPPTAPLEGLTFDWSLPSGSTVLEDAKEDLRVLRIPEPGLHHMSVAVRDARGNSATAAAEVGLLEPPDYSLGLRIYPDNEFFRAPLTATIRTDITGGHPLDRVQAIKWTVDGRDHDQTGGTMRFLLETAGDHEITATAVTKSGWTFSQSTLVHIVANQPPSCAVSIAQSSGWWTVDGDCNDPDGRIAKYVWTLDGAALAVNARRISISRTGRTTPPEVTLTATDDSGASSAVITAPPSAFLTNSP